MVQICLGSNGMKIGAWLSEQRSARGWTQSALARQIDSDAGSVSRWERGKVAPDLESFRKLCVVFGASADVVLQLEANLHSVAADDEGEPDGSTDEHAAPATGAR